MRNKLDFYYDCSSPWTYLAFEQLCRRKTALEISWKPILVGGVFNTVNPSVYAARENPVPAKQSYAQKDLQDWSEYLDIQIGLPDVFPINSAKAMRGAIVADEFGKIVEYSKLVFDFYWGKNIDISISANLKQIAGYVGLDWENFSTKIEHQNYKDELRSNTTELIERGGFGSPTYFLNGDDMFFGNDRMDLMFKRVDRLK